MQTIICQVQYGDLIELTQMSGHNVHAQFIDRKVESIHRDENRLQDCALNGQFVQYQSYTFDALMHKQISLVATIKII